VVEVSARAATGNWMAEAARVRGGLIKGRDDSAVARPAMSPLGLATSEPLSNDLVAYLGGR
jgi:hypothetical protein